MWILTFIFKNQDKNALKDLWTCDLVKSIELLKPIKPFIRKLLEIIKTYYISNLSYWNLLKLLNLKLVNNGNL